MWRSKSREHSYPAATIIRQENTDFLARQEALREILIEGVDYGNPGGRWPKPSMYQTGANKIIARLRLWHRAEVIDSWRDSGGHEYGATILVTVMAGHQPVATGLGYADTFEKRRQDGNGSAWVGNTVYQMAHKRGKVSAARLISGLDSEFTQDIEDGGLEPPRANGRTGERNKPASKATWDVRLCNRASDEYGIDRTEVKTILGIETFAEWAPGSRQKPGIASSHTMGAARMSSTQPSRSNRSRGRRRESSVEGNSQRRTRVPVAGRKSGMTLRDYFAGQAISALVTEQTILYQHAPETNAEYRTLATHAYALADAMLEAGPSAAGGMRMNMRGSGGRTWKVVMASSTLKYECGTCFAGFETAAELQAHYAVEFRPFWCGVCLIRWRTEVQARLCHPAAKW